MIYGEYVPIGLQQALLNHLWQSTAVVLMVWALTAILRNHRAGVRYALWMTASVKFLLPFSLLFSIGQLAQPMAANTERLSRMSGIVVRSVEPYTIPAYGSSIGASSATTSNSATERILILLLCIWAAGALVMLASWLRAWLTLYSIARRARPAGEVSGVPVLRCESVIEPGVFGIVRPRILIPGDFLTRMPKPELDVIYMHELCHVRRRDNLFSALHVLVHAIFWFHPAVWLIRAKLLDERERACDEHVVTCGKDAEVYALSILGVCRFYVEASAEAMAGVTGGELKRRIQRIVNNLPYQELTLGRKLALGAAAAFVISLPVTAGLIDARQVHAQSEQQPSLPGASDHAQAFEVAVVRPSHLTPGCFSILPPGSTHFNVTCVSLRGLIAMAYRLSDSRIDGPSKELDRLYDINATTGDHALQEADVAPLLRTLLTERFHLQVHTTERPVSGFELVIANGGPKLKKTAAAAINEAQGIHAGQGSPNFIMRGMIQGTAANMQTVAGLLGIPAGGPVVDRTGLQGFYDVSLHFAPEDAKDSDLPDFFVAVEEQLGLKLKPAKVPTKFLVVDSVNPKPALD